MPQEQKTKSNTAAGLESYLGKTIRALRQSLGLTIANVSDRANISGGMLSKIENGQTATSLDTLLRISQALGVSLPTLFKNFGVHGGGAQHVVSGRGMEVVRRGTKDGHAYHLLAYDQGPRKSFEPFLITIDDKTEEFPNFEHPGTEFLYILEGSMDYRHGEQVYRLNPGDSLTFHAETPHGPGTLYQVPIRFISVILYPQRGDE